MCLKYALILIFWKCFKSNELNCMLLLVYIVDIYMVFVYLSPANILIKFACAVLSCAIIVKKNYT
jgi:hypothetical protein